MSHEDADLSSSGESEEEIAHLEILSDLLDTCEARYREQAKILLRGRELWKTYENMILVYSLENRGCAIRSSVDGGFDFHVSSWVPLSGNKAKKIRILEFEFARSEAELGSQL